ncbi:RICIN domain-containing protein [Actinoplanes palleronii]|uniref:Ricin B lectin domain-containing protein n=1 Tax=Actinoplanes palleronii TaxID=113570 RepID=A0ABQ4BEK5_9ACTN|nr:RICIN domain-containing protein [Actinoplanes palleronii]GIE68771.1 hypothetical protein Apa02nite_048790 [Actinoplanes palleronii]
MNGEDFGSDRDPLLVRPFVVQDDETEEQASSDATWPGTAAEDSPTQVLPIFTGGTDVAARSARRGRRPLLLAGAAAVVIVLGAAGYTAMRPDFQPALSADLPDHSLPAVTGPAVVSPSPSVEAGDDGRGADSGTGSESGQDADKPATSKPTTVPASAKASVPVSAPTSAAVTTAPTTPAALAPSPLMAGTGTLVSGNGLCLDVPGAIPSDDNNIQVFDCNQSVAQVWTLADDGTLRVMGRCALLVGDDTVRLTTCDGRTTAQWRATGARELVNAAGSSCLTDPSGGGRPGTRVLVVKCTGQSNQQWSLR